MDKKDRQYTQGDHGLWVQKSVLQEAERLKDEQKRAAMADIHARIARVRRERPYVPELDDEDKAPAVAKAKSDEPKREMTAYEKAVAQYQASGGSSSSSAKIPSKDLLLEDPEPVEGEVKVFSRRAFAELVVGSEASTPGREERSRYAALYRRVLSHNSGVMRVAVPDPQDIGEVGLRCPNFSHVTKFIADRAMLAQRGQIDFYVPPILLWGPPGIGKSHFARLLADALKVDRRMLDFSSPVVGDQLCGSDKHWGNTTHGCVADALIFGRSANPLILVDELDKAAANSSRQSPAMPLLSALEPGSAKTFRDISLGIEFDARRVTWLCLANTVDTIPVPLLSRLKIFQIALPTGKDKVTFAREVAAGAIADFGLKTAFKEPSKEVVEALSGYTAREIYKLVQDGVVRAIREMRTGLLVDDLKEEKTNEKR